MYRYTSLRVHVYELLFHDVCVFVRILLNIHNSLRPCAQSVDHITEKSLINYPKWREKKTQEKTKLHVNFESKTFGWMKR